MELTNDMEDGAMELEKIYQILYFIKLNEISRQYLDLFVVVIIVVKAVLQTKYIILSINKCLRYPSRRLSCFTFIDRKEFYFISFTTHPHNSPPDV